ncbi:hypothetical protein HU727_000100 [Pseudomonas sp. SWRI153]|uniref:Uncharacterized protein n=1 Tax=Pseudomonas khorasanensis TaxID=2745508 RepID=A0A923F526_9PSED|nr:hypothetical protein [Pseudomonas khorasanensis]MBV4483984.1 hypothetical protein [Pseudomonas khorasanensis]
MNDDSLENTADTLREIASLIGFAPWVAIYDYAQSLNTAENLELLNKLAAHARLDEKVNQEVKVWENQKIKSTQTRLIVKIKNTTSHTFDINKNSLALTVDEQDYLKILPQEIEAFHCDFTYSRQLGTPDKDIYKHFIIFGNESLGFRFDFGLRVNTSFGVFTPTLTPVRTSKVASIGTTPIKCTSQITRAEDNAPYSFSVEITLG